jgi:methylmalonyl-CoA mutase
VKFNNASSLHQPNSTHTMASEEQLFKEFPPVTAEQWVQQVVKDLKGESFEEKLTYQSPEGIVVKPFYTQEDLAKYSERKPLFSHSDWEVCVEIDGTDEKSGNAKALHALNNGTSALLMFVYHNADLNTLLKDIQIEYISVQFLVEGDAAIFNKKLSSYLKLKDLDRTTLNISINIDPIENLVRTGNWRNSFEKDKAELISLISDRKKALCINSNIYHNAGAPAAYEIACTLAHANTYINWCEEQKNAVADLSGFFQLNIATGPNYFFEIAKLRALRKVFALLFEETGISSDITIHVETAFRNLTVFDTHNNLLRTTTAAMAATIGGCSSLTVKPFDSTFDPGNEFSERLARNIQLILKSESYFDKIADASAGSYFIEELTEQIAAKAWEYFTGIEQQGGFIACLEKGLIQQTIYDFAAVELEKFETGEEVLVGTNKFPNPKEDKKDKANSIVWGNDRATGKTIAPLLYTRLAANNEKQRLSEKV